MEYGRLASELMRALRGRRSQSDFSKRLGYASNVAYTWEAGRAWPAASRFFQIVESTERSAVAVLAAFHQHTPPGLAQSSPVTKSGVASLLRDLRGHRTVNEVARVFGCERHCVSRWFRGVAEPRLPDFLRLVDVLSLRLLDFIAAIVDPSLLPSASEAWARLQAARGTAYDAPWSHAVLRAIEIEGYQQLNRHVPGWLATRVGIARTQEDEALSLLEAAGQIRLVGGRWEVIDAHLVDTRHERMQARRQKEFWAQVAVDRLCAGVEGVFSYNLFAVSKADLERIAALQRAYYRDLRAIVEQSRPTECVALATHNLVELGEPPSHPSS